MMHFPRATVHHPRGEPRDWNALKGHAAAARGHFLWVKEHGSSRPVAFTIALAERENVKG